jgi:bacterioferritin (cytochrome b1)
MKKENNNTNYLNTLLKYKLITLKQYYFRKKAKELNINTCKY